MPKWIFQKTSGDQQGDYLGKYLVTNARENKIMKNLVKKLAYDLLG